MGRSSSRSKSRSRSGSGGSRSRSGSLDKTGRKRRSYSRSPASDDENKCRVHIADLGLDPSKSEIYRAFEKFGPLREIWVARTPPCFAFVVYKYKDDAAEAVRKMDGESLNGKRIRVSIAKPRMKVTRGIPNTGGVRNKRCYNCLDFGHLARDCRNRHKNRSRSRSRDRYDRRRSRSRSGSRSRRNRSRSRQRDRSGSRDRRRDYRRSSSRGRESRSARDRSRDRKDRSTSRDRDSKLDRSGDGERGGSVDRKRDEKAKGDSKERKNEEVKKRSRSRERDSESVDRPSVKGRSASPDDKKSVSEEEIEEAEYQDKKVSDGERSRSVSPSPVQQNIQDDEYDRASSARDAEDSNMDNDGDDAN